MRCSKSRADLLIFLLMDAHNSQKRFVKKYLTLLSYCIVLADKFPNMILLYSLKSSYKRTPETLNKRAPPFFSVSKKQFPRNRRYEIVILQETNGMWRCSEL